MSKKVLFVSHKKTQCGVYEFGNEIFQAISGSSVFEIKKAECSSLTELKLAIAAHQPELIIYNYHPSVLPWLSTKISKGIYRNNITKIKAVQVGLIHEITQEIADKATAYRNKWVLGPSGRKLNSLFDYYIAADPTLLLKNPLVFKTGRLIPEYKKPATQPPVFTIGSFGFATPKKGFEKMVERVQEEFNEALIRLNMPAADFGDKDGLQAKAIAENCRKLIRKPGIKLEVSHNFMNKEQLLDFLGANSMNVFMYEDKEGRGLSSAVDNALAVKKPVAVSNCPMFRHLLNAKPTVCTEEATLEKIYKNGFGSLEKILGHWNKENLLWDYERIMNAVLLRVKQPRVEKMGIIRSLKSVWNRLFSLPDQTFTWLRNTDAATGDDLNPVTNVTYTPVQLPAANGFNRILDDSARSLYAPAVKKLFELAPITMSKKIARANVQQAFVFDTVYRLSKSFDKPGILCAGSYEDTASMGLQKMGFEVEEIDPMINYTIQEFYSKPSTIKNAYSIIFSTSVIEHDPDDESFMKSIAGLLAPGGYAVITCDYKDGWKPGEPKPEVDARFYVKEDLEKRLLSYIPGCRLLDTPNWDCPHPDFNYLGKYQYTFAGFVVQKDKD